MTDRWDEEAERLGGDIDAILHAGQRAEPRYRKFTPTIAAALRAAYEAGREDAANVAETFAVEHKKWRSLFPPHPQGVGDALARHSTQIAAAIRTEGK